MRAGPGEHPEDTGAGEKLSREARAKNRAALAWIVVVCSVMGALGFLFALWLRSRPA